VKAIIFGVTGQDGLYLKSLLLSKGIEVIGVARTSGDVIGDISDFEFVQSLVKDTCPHYLFHFAANSTTRHSAIFENHNVISTGTINVLEAVRLHSPKTRVFLSGSAMQFQNDGEPISESTPFEGSSPYSVARIQSVYMARYYQKRFFLKVYVGYFFNHDSCFRTENHVNQKIAAAARRIKEGSMERLQLGNIQVKKEFNFAGDIVEAVWAIVNQEKIFELIIGSGVSYTIQEWLECCFGKIGKDWRSYVDIIEEYIPEYNILVSDPKILKNLGWRPKVCFEALVEKMVGDKL
jgi:GDPmannose 4,6-dehydratase